MQSVVMQMCVLPMYLELKDRTPEKFRDVTRVSFVVLMFLFSSFAVFGYEAFGQETQSNVLLELPLTQWGVFPFHSPHACLGQRQGTFCREHGKDRCCCLH